MEFASFVVFFIIACTLGLFLVSVSSFLGAKRKLKRTNDVYESGVNPAGNTNRQYDIKFYLTAILFLLFDVEIVFLLPWALAYNQGTTQTYMLLDFLFFMAILLVGYFYIIKSKALKWEE